MYTYACSLIFPSFFFNCVQTSDDGKLQAETDSGEFWLLFGGFAPIGKKVATEDDIIPEKTPAQLYRYLTFISYSLLSLR